MPEDENTVQGCCQNQEMKCGLREELMEEIRSCSFAINDLALYLDTHPNDKRALCLHNNNCNHLRELIDRYQKKFGPLSINCPCNKWRWLNANTWPWEGSEM